MKTMLLATLFVALSAGSAFSDNTTQTVRQLPACGSEATNAFGIHKEYPAIDEGSGYVGFKTDDVDAKGDKERYTLVNCVTRAAVQLNAEYLLTDSSKGLPKGKDLFAFVDALRKQKKLANEALFAATAKGNGYSPIVGKQPKAFTEKARRADCGCQLYYPETVAGWN
jgi:hypothetical protein